MSRGAYPSEVKFAVAMALTAGESRADVAQKFDITEATLSTWVNRDPDFADLLADLRAAFLEKVTGEIAQHLGKARETLVRALDSKVVHAEVRASIALFDLYFKAGEISELRDRLARLEAQLADEKESYP